MDEMMENLKHGIVSEAIDADALEQFADEQQTIREKLDRHYEKLCEMDKTCATLQREIMSAQIEIAVLMRDLQKMERPV